jgi:23S rRNA (cytosine1962-C5)-methyltransferase
MALDIRDPRPGNRERCAPLTLNMLAAMSYPRIDVDLDRLPTGPWIYGRQCPHPKDAPPDGSMVEVYDRAGRFFGHGFYNGTSDIRIRLLSRGKKTAMQRPREFLQKKLAAADRLRRKGLKLERSTNAYRVVHAEGDDLSGLVVDRLGAVLVCEYHALGFYLMREDVEWALGQLYPGYPVIHRVPKSALNKEGFGAVPEVDSAEIEITENGLRYPVLPGQGHKTGWFCDQRENRAKVGALAEGLDVLDVCTNAGAFALHAARAGARRVRAVDLDEVVLERGKDAARRNELDVEFQHEDAYNTLRRVRSESRRPGLVVIDPPKLIRGKADLEKGLKNYGDMNHLAAQATAPGGFLATFSCSGALDLPAFLGMVFQAARRAERSVRLLEVLGAAADHPQRPEFTRSRYLKGALLAVD